MNKLNFRGNKKGVTPVIATIILIAGTLVLALVVGAYTFGLFGSNVKTVTLPSATLYGGYADPSAGQTPSYVTFSLNNPGSGSAITGVTITGSAIISVVAFNNASSTGSCSGTCSSVFSGVSSASGSQTANILLTGGQVSSYTWYLAGSFDQPVTTGQTFNYVVNFANGQSVSGSLIAQ